MRTSTANKQTAVRFNPLVLARAKEAARLANTSFNEFVNSVVEKATEDIRTPEEIEEEKRLTKEFLETFAGKWPGEESAEEIMHSIKDGNIISGIVEL